MTKAFRVDVRVRHNRLIKAREELGLTQHAAADMIGVSPSQLGLFENLRESPLKDGEWRPPAVRIAEFYGYSPEYLWPEEISVVRKNAARLELGAAEVAVLVGGEYDAAQLRAKIDNGIKALHPRVGRVIRERFYGDKTLNEIASDMQLTRERVRSIEQQALRELRDRLGRDTRPIAKVDTSTCCRCAKKFVVFYNGQKFCSRKCVSRTLSEDGQTQMKIDALASARHYKWPESEKWSWKTDEAQELRASFVGAIYRISEKRRESYYGPYDAWDTYYKVLNVDPVRGSTARAVRLVFKNGGLISCGKCTVSIARLTAGSHDAVRLNADETSVFERKHRDILNAQSSTRRKAP